MACHYPSGRVCGGLALPGTRVLTPMRFMSACHALLHICSLWEPGSSPGCSTTDGSRRTQLRRGVSAHRRERPTVGFSECPWGSGHASGDFRYRDGRPSGLLTAGPRRYALPASSGSCSTSLCRALWSRIDHLCKPYGVIHTEYKGLRPQGMFRIISACFRTAKVAELVDALVLGASGETRESSNLSFRTTVFASSDISRARRRSFGIR